MSLTNYLDVRGQLLCDYCAHVEGGQPFLARMERKRARAGRFQNTVARQTYPR